jgi:hypothetical protein
MSPVKATECEKAFMMRVERKTYAEIARELGVSSKTVTRWENGWTGRAGQKHEGWKERLDKAWKERLESQLNYGLLMKEGRLRAYEMLARMALARAQEAIPVISVKNAATVKMLLSEVRALLRQINEEKAADKPSPETPTGTRVDISLEEIQERYAAAKAREAEYKEMTGKDTRASNALPDSSEAEYRELPGKDTGNE